MGFKNRRSRLFLSQPVCATSDEADVHPDRAWKPVAQDELRTSCPTPTVQEEQCNDQCSEAALESSLRTDGDLEPSRNRRRT